MDKLSFKRWVAVFGVLTLIASITATQLLFRSNDLTFNNWVGIFVIQVLIWYVWGGLTPLIFNLSKRISDYTSSRLYTIVYHLPISIAVVVTFLSFYSGIFLLFGGSDLDQFFTTFLTLFISLFHWYLILYWITVGVETYLRMIDQYKIQEMVNLQLEGQLTQAHLIALKMQLNPHFLFNSLNAISGLIRTSESKKATAMLAKLSDFLREVIIDKGRQEITVKDEVEFVEKYLEIEKLRFGNKLRVEIAVEAEAEKALIPSLLLQPLVENAIKHGVSKSRTAELVRLSVIASKGRLRIEVYNEGPPLTNTVSMTGIGMHNTKERLNKLYANDHYFNLANADKGVRLQIELPLNYQEIEENVA